MATLGDIEGDKEMTVNDATAAIKNYGACARYRVARIVRLRKGVWYLNTHPNGYPSVSFKGRTKSC
jgi:hypothetical protein